MGLCKCPKKKVTNQFCFEHRVNVCEHCMVTDHSTCVVQSYLQWLSDSDYNPVCRICDDQLVTGECIRLTCYDLFHKDCLNDWALRLPPNTAPAGFKCPACSGALFPPSNLVSPIASALVQYLESLPWARTGLGLPLIETSNDVNGVTNGWSIVNESTSNNDHPPSDLSSRSSVQIQQESNNTSYNNEVTAFTQQGESSLLSNRIADDSGGLSSLTSREIADNSVRITAREDPPITPQQYTGSVAHPSSSGAHPTSKGARSGSTSETQLLLDDDVDADENKYKRRPATEWFSRWWRTMSKPPSRHHQTLLGGKRRMVVLLGLLAGGTLLMVLSYLAHSSSDNDPMLDPLNNPNIRVEED